jgi:hypothetical protein
MLILSTNRDPEKVMDAAFLRRMGYRLYLAYVSTEQYEKIFRSPGSRSLKFVELPVPNG